jgi:hypothetical protein
MFRDFGTIARNKAEIKEGAIVMLPGVDTNISIQVDGTNAITNLDMKLFQGTKDATNSNLIGSMSVNGRRITTKTFTGLIGGLEYGAAIFFKDGGVGTSRLVNIQCLKKGVNPSHYQQTDYLKYRIEESPIMILPGQTFTASVTIAGYGVITNPSMQVYKGTKDVSNDVLSGSMSASERTVVLKPIANLVGGNKYLMYLFFSDDGKNTWRYAELICPKIGAQ